MIPRHTHSNHPSMRPGARGKPATHLHMERELEEEGVSQDPIPPSFGLQASLDRGRPRVKGHDLTHTHTQHPPTHTTHTNTNTAFELLGSQPETIPRSSLAQPQPGLSKEPRPRGSEAS